MKQASTARGKRHFPAQRLTFISIFFITMFLFWLVLSGHFQLKYIIIGLFAAAIVTILSKDLFYSHLYDSEHRHRRMVSAVAESWRFLLYLPWLFGRIVMANLQVAYIVLHPRLPIDPVFLQFRTRLPRTIARVILANSITLTPGTVTVDLEEDRYVVHTLAIPLAEDLTSATMQNRIGTVFHVAKEPPPEIITAYTIGELES